MKQISVPLDRFQLTVFVNHIERFVESRRQAHPHHPGSVPVVPKPVRGTQRHRDNPAAAPPPMLACENPRIWARTSLEATVAPLAPAKSFKTDEILRIIGQGSIVFLPFAAGEWGTIACADGHVFGKLEEDGGERSEFLLWEHDCLGFLVQAVDGRLTIRSGVYSRGLCNMPSSRIDLYENCGVFDPIMVEYLDGFAAAPATPRA